MAPIGGIAPGESSGVYDLLQQYMVSERVPMTRLRESEADLQTRSAVLTDLGTKLRALRSAVDDFRWPGSLTPLNAFTATSSDTSVIEATAGGGATEGPHTVAVKALARAHSIASLEFRGDEESSLSGEYGFRIVQGQESHQVSVTIEAADSYREVLGRVVDAINLSGVDATATLAATDSRTGAYRVLLTSRITGTQGIIDQVIDTSGNLADLIGLAGSSAAGAYSANTVQAAADASFSVDGLDFVSSTNRVTDALTGVTLNLNGVSSAPVTVAITRDVEAVRTSVEELLGAYNDLVDYVRGKTQGADESGEGRGMFTGNTLFMTLRTLLRRAATDEVPDPAGAGGLHLLSQIGISADREGHLSISDGDAFEDALQAGPREVERLFSDDEEGVAVRLVDLMDSFVGARGLLGTEQRLMRTRERTLQQRIARMEAYLSRREEQLTKELAGLQALMAQLDDQQRYIDAMFYGM